MVVEQYTVGPLQTNCYIVTCEKTGDSVVIDPGDISPQLMDALEGRPVSAILLTHGHFDHIAGIRVIHDETGAPVHIHTADREMLRNPQRNGAYLVGVDMSFNIEPVLVAHGDVIEFGASSLHVRHTPGHSPGGVSYVGNNFVIAGDTLFRYSVGRWDLYGGDFETLMHSISSQLMTLPGETIVYPGHGESTDIAFESRHNEFIRGR